MTVTNGLLCRGKKVVVPQKLKNEVISLVHNEGHLGIDNTTRLIRNNFFWIRMDRDVEEFCRGCLICQRNKPKHQPKGKLTPIHIAKKPREVIAYDVATLPWATSDHRYFLLLVDLFSKYIELVPMADQESETISNAIQNGWIYRHGPPVTVLSDQGPNVDGSHIRETLAKYGINKLRSSPYHPAGDGQSERGIQSVKQIMRCLLEERNLSKDSWPSLLPQVSYILNCIPNSSTGFSPFRIMYGIDPKPLSMATLDKEVQGHYYSVIEWIEENQRLEGMVNEEVEENLVQACHRMKSIYDTGKKDSEIRPRDYVLVRVHTRKSGLDRQFEGPYTVLQHKGPLVLIRYIKGKRASNKWIHLNRCKQYMPIPHPEVDRALTSKDESEYWSESDSAYSPQGKMESYDRDPEVRENTGEDPYPATQPRRSGRIRRLPERFRDSRGPEYSTDHSSESE